MEARAELPQANNHDTPSSVNTEGQREASLSTSVSGSAPEPSSGSVNNTPSPAAAMPPIPSGATHVSVSEDQVKLALRRVKDPDLHLNIVDLGLVYAIRVDSAAVAIDVTLTSPACPSGPEIISGMEQEVRAIPGVESVQVNLIWAPFWTPDRIEPRVRAYLGL